MEWTTETNTAQKVQHSTHCSLDSSNHIKHIVEQTIEKAISLLHDNIEDDSLYFLVEWDACASNLSVVVTDDTKTKEATHGVCCYFTDRTSDKQEELDVSLIHYWVRDLLTTNTAFIRFSLVAIFSHGDRTKTELL